MAHPRHKKYPQLRVDILKPRVGYRTRRGYINDTNSDRAPLTFDTGKTTIKEAKEILEQKIEEIYGNEQTIDDIQKYQHQKTVSNILDDYMKYYIEKHGNKKTPERNKLNIQNQKSQCRIIKNQIGHLTIKSLDKEIINSYITTRLKTCKPGSVLREIRLLKTSINLLPNSTAKYINDKIKGHTTFKKRVDIHPRDAFIEPEHMEKIIEEFDRVAPDFTLIVKLLHYIGARGDEIRKLKWHEINWKERCIELPPERTKEQDVKTMYMSDECYNGLLTLRDNCQVDKQGKPIHENVFLHNNKLIYEKLFYRKWHHVMQNCGLTKYENDKQVSIYLPHDIRHTRVVLNEMAGIPRNLTMMQTGHKSMETFQYYNTPSKVQQKKIIELQNQAKVKLEQERKEEYERFRKGLEKVRDEQGIWSTDEEFEKTVKMLWEQTKIK